MTGKALFKPSKVFVRTSRPGSSERRIRADIQGLRAFAVLVVVLDHTFGWPGGGFVGVDVFFVISGFLITGLLMREWEKSGRISFAKFYLRRVKRILPASALVLITTVVLGFTLFSSGRAWTIFWDGIWSAIFVANWRSAAVGTDYFQAEGPASPLRHFWSLAVEEQFYFVWPCLLAAVLWLSVKMIPNRISPRGAAGCAIAVISLGSMLLALGQSSDDATLAYYSTWTRAWELGIGSLLAIASPWLVKLPNVMRPWFAWSGLLLMVSSIFVTNASGGFPMPGALLPVFATSVVIASGTGGTQRFLAPLTNRVATYIGDISFSLYLWHWPVLVFTGAVLTEGSLGFQLTAVYVMFFMSMMAFHLIESPIRSSSWLSGGSRSSSRRRRTAAVRQAWAEVFTPRYQMTALVFFGIFALSAISVPFIYSPAQPASGMAAATPSEVISPKDEKAEIGFGPEVTAIQSDLSAALSATNWPVMSPSIEDAIGSAQAKPSVSFCGMPEKFDLSACTIGGASPSKRAVLLGNSSAMTFATPLAEALGDDWDLVVHAAYGCPYSSVFIPSADVSVAEDCGVRNAYAPELIRKINPDVVFVIDSYTLHTAAGATSPLPADQWSRSVNVAVDEFRGSTNKVVFITAPPRGGNLADCYTTLSRPASCISTPSEYWYDLRAADISETLNAGAVFVDTLPLFCTRGRCPSFADGVPMKSDGTHMTIEYGQKITPGLRELLNAAGVLGDN